MLLKIDPRWPLVWRDPVTLQIGLDPPRVVLDHLESVDERMIAALTVGITRDGLEVVSDGATAAADALLERLAPVLLTATEPAAPATIAISGSGRLIDLTARVLGELGHRVLIASSAERLADADPDLAVIVGHWVLPPDVHAFWLRRDVPHLPVVFSDTAVHLGPMIEPGDGPCLLCLELHRRDADDAWPTIATQLLGRAAGAQSPALVAEGAATLVRLVAARLRGRETEAYSLRIAPNGDRLRTTWVPHPECGCRGIAHLVDDATTRPGNGSPAGRIAPVHPLPTRGRDAASRA